MNIKLNELFNQVESLVESYKTSRSNSFWSIFRNSSLTTDRSNLALGLKQDLILLKSSKDSDEEILIKLEALFHVAVKDNKALDAKYNKEHPNHFGAWTYGGLFYKKNQGHPIWVNHHNKPQPYRGGDTPDFIFGPIFTSSYRHSLLATILIECMTNIMTLKDKLTESQKMSEEFKNNNSTMMKLG